VKRVLFAVGLFIATVMDANAQVKLIAIGSLTSSSAGPNADLSGSTNTLENGAPANLLGGLGSGITWAGGNTFLAVPDRGPNAVGWAGVIDDTASYIERFQTINMDLEPNAGAGLPFTLTPNLQATTLFFSASRLVYGAGGQTDNVGNIIGSGVPPQNRPSHNYFTGRSDNFDPNQNSGNPKNARLDSEGIRVSHDVRVYTSDEYGPYVNEFLPPDNASAASACPTASTLITSVRRARLKFPATPADASPIKAWKGLQSHQTAPRWSASCKMRSSRTQPKAAPLPICCASSPSIAMPGR